MAKDVLFVIDSNWYIHRAANTLHTHRQDLGKALARHFLSIVCKDALAVKATHLILAFDGPKVFRYKIYPCYKSGRKEGKKITTIDSADVSKTQSIGVDEDSGRDETALYDHLPTVFKYLERLGIAFYQPTKYEADDALCSLARRYGPVMQVVCGTQDKDAYQYLDVPNVRLYDSSYKDPKTKKAAPRYIDAKFAERVKGVRVSQMVDYQTLLGDKGDSIDGLPGYGPKTTAKVLEKYGSIAKWMKKGTQEEKQFLAEHQARLILNRKLVTLVDTVLPPFELDDAKPERISDKKKDKIKPPTAYINWIEWLHPRSKGLFSKFGK